MQASDQSSRRSSKRFVTVPLILLLGLMVGLTPVPDLRADVLSDRSIRAVESVPRGVSPDHPGIPQTGEVWREMIERAEETIRIGAFYVQNREGSRLDGLLERLKERAGDGIRVQVVTDTSFYSNAPEDVDRLRQTEGISVRVIDLAPNLSGVMHSKYMIVDDSRAYVGSANVDWRSLEHIREVGVVFSDPHLIEDLTSIFETDWTLAGMTEEGRRDLQSFQSPVTGIPSDDTGFPRPDGRSSRLVASPPSITPEGIMPSEEAVLRLIREAEEEIFLDLYKYDPWDFYNDRYYDRIDRSLRRAEARGVEVKVLVGDWTVDRTSEQYLKSLSMLDGVEVRVIGIPQHETGYIPFARVSHAKLMVVDRSVAWTGSTNFQWSYFTQSRNVDVVTWDPKTVSELGRFFLSGWENELTDPLDPTRDYQPPSRAEP